MSTVYLLRHGQASFGADDYDVLSPLGAIQAKTLGADLLARGITPAAAWSGALSRQRDTASIALAAAGLDLECGVDQRWDEYDLVGLVSSFSGPPPTTSREFQAQLDLALRDWVGTDGFAEFSGRVNAALDEVASGLGSGGVAVVFTSGGVIAAICARLLGLPPAGFVKVNRVSVNAGLTKVVHGRSGLSLVSFNEHGHFDGPNRELLTYR